MRFDGKVVAIVGAATGLGRAAAQQFAREGARLFLVDINEGGLSSLCNELEAKSVEIDCHAGDSSLAATSVAAVKAIESRFGRLDILFNNAGINPIGSLAETDESSWDRVINVNLKSIYNMCHQAIPVMKRQGGGVIVNTASIAALRASTGESAYAVSKAGVMMLTRTIARDHAKDNIRANALCPGILETVLADRRREMTEEQLAARSARARAMIPMGREGTYEEVARTVLFLASDDAAYITGTTLVVDGGLMA